MLHVLMKSQTWIAWAILQNLLLLSKQSHTQEFLFKFVLVKFESLPGLISKAHQGVSCANLPLRKVIINCRQCGFISPLAVEEPHKCPN